MNQNHFFSHATIMTLDEKDTILFDAYLVIEQGIISYVGTDYPKSLPASYNFVDANDLLLCPGLVNAHTHTPMTILRGFKDDVPMEEWLEHIWTAESALTNQDYYYSSLLGIAEMLAYGTTSISDMYRSSHTILQSAIDSGIKANICESITNSPGQDPGNILLVKESLELIRNYNGFDDGRIQCDTSIQSVFQTTPELWEFIADLALKENISIHAHLCETQFEMEYALKNYGDTPIMCLKKHGVFDSHVVAVHGIYVTSDELSVLSESKSSVVHDPCSNLKCCCGFANLKPFIQKGINVALGTDGVCSNNSGDMFDTMKFTALNQKMINNDPCFADANQVLSMAIKGGLKSQQRDHEAGMIVCGRDADIIALDLKHPGMTPLTSPASNLVYAAHGNHVVFTMVRGRMLYDKGEFPTIDVEKARYEINRRVMLVN